MSKLQWTKNLHLQLHLHLEIMCCVKPAPAERRVYIYYI